MSIFLIILAAGNGKRLKSKVPKPFYSINKKTLLEYSLEAFRSFPEIKKTLVVYNKKHKKYLNKISLNNKMKIVGGSTRQESTYLALKKIKKMGCSKVIIHDAARPNVSKKIIKELILSLKNSNAVIPVINVTDATKRVKKRIIFKNIKRNTLRLSQTPQGFNFRKIYKKHLENKNVSFDDDGSLFTNDNEKVHTINGSKKNLKVTDLEDLEIFKSLRSQKFYSGIGFDVHRLVPKRKLFLGGIKVKSKLGTLGHSDGDPVLHAIIDSILGACKMGDIGERFPDKKKKYKNMRSTLLLKKIINKCNSKGFYINNIDINIICQSPKVKKYKKNMIKCIARICKISSSQINIKGKTTEKLGVIGKEKAVASEAITSMTRYE